MSLCPTTASARHTQRGSHVPEEETGDDRKENFRQSGEREAVAWRRQSGGEGPDSRCGLGPNQSARGAHIEDGRFQLSPSLAIADPLVKIKRHEQ